MLTNQQAKQFGEAFATALASMTPESPQHLNRFEALGIPGVTNQSSLVKYYTVQAQMFLKNKDAKGGIKRFSNGSARAEIRKQVEQYKFDINISDPTYDGIWDSDTIMSSVYQSPENRFLNAANRNRLYSVISGVKSTKQVTRMGGSAPIQAYDCRPTTSGEFTTEQMVVDVCSLMQYQEFCSEQLTGSVFEAWLGNFSTDRNIPAQFQELIVWQFLHVFADTLDKLFWIGDPTGTFSTSLESLTLCKGWLTRVEEANVYTGVSATLSQDTILSDLDDMFAAMPAELRTIMMNSRVAVGGTYETVGFFMNPIEYFAFTRAMATLNGNANFTKSGAPDTSNYLGIPIYVYEAVPAGTVVLTYTKRPGAYGDYSNLWLITDEESEYESYEFDRLGSGTDVAYFKHAFRIGSAVPDPQLIVIAS